MTTQGAGGVRLTLERIETIPVVAPLPRVFQGSYYRMTHRATVVTRLYTREGIVGEAYAGDEVDTLDRIGAAITSEIAPRILGQDLLATQRIWAAAYPVTFDILRDRRIGLVAQACVDAAMWDAVGKALGVPLHRLWGGFRDRVPMIAIGGYYGEPSGPIEAEMEYYRSIGLAGVKFKVGGLPPDQDAARVARARRAADTDFVIAVDANQGYTVSQAIAFCRAVADLNIRWFEEPVGWANDRRDLATVRQVGGLPVAAGQSELSPAGCPAADGGRCHRRLQLRRLLVGRPDRVAADRRPGPHLQRGDGAPRGASGRDAPDRQPAARHVRRVLPPGPRPVLVEPRAEPAAAGRRLPAAAHRARAGLAARPGLHQPVPGRPVSLDAS